MKVKELIERLEEFNPDADVSLSVTGMICSEDIEIGYIALEAGGTIEYTPETSKQVFIEGVDYDD